MESDSITLSEGAKLVFSYASFLTPSKHATNSKHVLLALLLLFEDKEHPFNHFAMKSLKKELKEDIEGEQNSSVVDLVTLLQEANRRAQGGEVTMQNITDALVFANTQARDFCVQFNKHRKSQRWWLVLAAGLMVASAWGLLVGGFSPLILVPVSFAWGWSFATWLRLVAVSWAPMDLHLF